EVPESTVTTANAMQARLSGNPRAALDQMTAMVADAMWAQPLYDRTNGYSTFTRLHLGFTQMLAGDLVAARTQLAAAKVTPPPEPLTMLLRDAYAKSAVLNAVFGSRRDAQRDIDI